MVHVQPRQASSHPSVHFTSHPVKNENNEEKEENEEEKEVNEEEKEENEEDKNKEEKGLIMADWLLLRGMDRVQPTPMTALITTTTPVAATAVPMVSAQESVSTPPTETEVADSENHQTENKTDSEQQEGEGSE